MVGAVFVNMSTNVQKRLDKFDCRDFENNAMNLGNDKRIFLKIQIPVLGTAKLGEILKNLLQ